MNASSAARQVVLDTETTGLETRDGHRILEVGAVELIDRRVTRRQYHEYINPERRVDAEALEVHGLSNEFLAGKPKFAAIAQSLIDFIDGTELIIHNAEFDVGFLDYEFSMLSLGNINDRCQVLDSLLMAKKIHPGMRNSLDSLCRRYDVDNSRRDLHGALLDAQLLAEVYLRMTGGQTTLMLGDSGAGDTRVLRFPPELDRSIRAVTPTAQETAAHRQRLESIGADQWRKPINEATEVEALGA